LAVHEISENELLTCDNDLALDSLELGGGDRGRIS